MPRLGLVPSLFTHLKTDRAKILVYLLNHREMTIQGKDCYSWGLQNPKLQAHVFWFISFPGPRSTVSFVHVCFNLPNLTAMWMETSEEILAVLCFLRGVSVLEDLALILHA